MENIKIVPGLLLKSVLVRSWVARVGSEAARGEYFLTFFYQGGWDKIPPKKKMFYNK